jgi:hypothetical protein
MLKKHLLVAATLMFGLGAATQSQAYSFAYSSFNAGNVLTLDGSTVLSNTDSGWYDGYFVTDPSNMNYFVGEGFNNWFVFDISQLSVPVTTASFTVYAYQSSESTLYSMFDYAGSIAGLVGGIGGAAVHDDLASGTLYGSGVVGAANSNSFVSFMLTTGAVTDLNTAIRKGQAQFVIGGTTAPVPEPETYALMLAGLGVVACAARRRKA